MHIAAIVTFPIWAAGLLILTVAVLAAVTLEIVARRVIPLRIRLEHNASTAAVFTVTGTTYAVLLAFVAMLAWEGYNHAESVTDREAALVRDIYQLISGLTGPEMPVMRQDVIEYARTVARVEWPEQTAGQNVAEDEPHLARLISTALHLRPDNIADGDLHTLLLGDLSMLGSARGERLFIARTPIPAILWVVLLSGGAITVVFASLLGSSDLRMHLAMSSLLAISGALVLLVIVALSNPYRGDLHISSRPFEQVLSRMSLE